MCRYFVIPIQWWPSPLNPVLHWQKYPPAVFTHSASDTLQSARPALHSSTSVQTHTHTHTHCQYCMCSCKQTQIYILINAPNNRCIPHPRTHQYPCTQIQFHTYITNQLLQSILNQNHLTCSANTHRLTHTYPHTAPHLQQNLSHTDTRLGLPSVYTERSHHIWESSSLSGLNEITSVSS